MFKSNIKVKEVFTNEDWLKRVIMGADPEETDGKSH